MEKECKRTMRLEKRQGDRIWYPVSLTHIGEVVYGQDVQFGDKQIPEHEIYICVQGEAMSYLGDATYNVKRGTVLTYKPEEKHRTFITKPDFYERYVLLFHYEELADRWDGVEQSLLGMFSSRGLYEKNAIHLMPQEFQQLLFLLDRCAGYSQGDDRENDGLFYADFIKILQLLHNCFCHTQTRQETTARVPVVNWALEMIEKEFYSLQRVDQISSRLNVSDSYLARVFKKQVGTSVYEYILNMKFAHAVKLLSAGTSVTDACFESGFNSYSHFIQMFKRRYGMTPRKYQKSLDV